MSFAAKKNQYPVFRRTAPTSRPSPTPIASKARAFGQCTRSGARTRRTKSAVVRCGSRRLISTRLRSADLDQRTNPRGSDCRVHGEPRRERVCSRADVEQRTAALAPHVVHTRGGIERVARLPHLRSLVGGNAHGRARVGRDLDVERQTIPVETPMRSDEAVDRAIGRARVRQGSRDLRPHREMREPGMLRILLNAGDILEQPSSARAERA
jgi:hypothetical protein